MNPSAYKSYSHEASSWLHAGRSLLIQRVLSWYLTGPACDREVLELGAGVGQNIQVLHQFGYVDALEVDPLGLSSLRQMKGIRHIYDQGIPSSLGKKWNVILACDVLEHIEDDQMAVQWIFDHLKPGGIFLGTVPAFQWLFSEHDTALRHFRRYNAKAFDQLFPDDAIRLSGSYFNSYLFPFGLASRFVWQLGRRLSGWSNGESQKQSVPTNRLADSILRAVFMQEIANMSPITNRAFGLSYYSCYRKL